MPINGMTIKAPIKEIGIPIQTQIAMEGRKNNDNKANTKMPPCMALVVKVEIRALTI